MEETIRAKYRMTSKRDMLAKTLREKNRDSLADMPIREFKGLELWGYEKWRSREDDGGDLQNGTRRVSGYFRWMRSDELCDDGVSFWLVSALASPYPSLIFVQQCSTKLSTCEKMFEPAVEADALADISRRFDSGRPRLSASLVQMLGSPLLQTPSLYIWCDASSPTLAALHRL